MLILPPYNLNENCTDDVRNMTLLEERSTSVLPTKYKIIVMLQYADILQSKVRYKDGHVLLYTLYS